MYQALRAEQAHPPLFPAAAAHAMAPPPPPAPCPCWPARGSILNENFTGLAQVVGQL
jgi:hypothetical protein